MSNEDAQDKKNAQNTKAPEGQKAGEKRLPPPLPSELRPRNFSFDDSAIPDEHFDEAGGAFWPDTPPFGETIAIYLLSGVLLIVLGSALQYLHLFSGLFISQIAFIAGPAYLYTAFRNYNVPRTFSFTPIRIKTVVLAILIACSAFMLVGIVAVLQELLLPRSPEYIAIWEDVMLKFREAPLTLTLFVVSVLPGVCEELLFRGFLLQGMRKKMADIPAIILVGVLFGLFHLDFYRFLPVSLLGILFGCIVVKTGSIFPAMLAHGVNNAITIFLSYGATQVQDVEQFADSSSLEELFSVKGAVSLLVIASLAVFVLWAALRALPETRSESNRSE